MNKLLALLEEGVLNLDVNTQGPEWKPKQETAYSGEMLTSSAGNPLCHSLQSSFSSFT
ncbi:hypothetical protein E2320_006232, partial [Naja naja]